MREVPEWIATHDDQAIPPRVRVRVFERFHGVCQIAKRKIRAGEPWDCDHIIALINGGQHREKNLRPVLRDKHRKEKNPEDMRVKKKIVRQRARHLGIKKPGRSLSNPKLKRRFDGSVVAR